MRFARVVLAGLALCAATLAPRIAPAQAATGAIWVRVLGPDSLPLTDVEVALPMLGVVLRVPEGGALLITGVPAGSHVLQARRVGLAPAWHTLRVGSDTTLVQLALQPVNVLDTVTVIGELSPVESRLLAFERRRRTSGFGRFVTRADITEWRSVDMAAVLRHVNGLVVRTGPGGATVSTRRQPAFSTCSGMLVFLDGVLVSGTQSGGGARLPTTALSGKNGLRPNAPPAAPAGGTTNTSTGTGSGSGSGAGSGTGSGGSGTGTVGAGSGGARPARRAGTAVSAGGGAPDWSNVAPGPAGVAAFDLNAIPVPLVAGVEVYTSGAGIPAEYAGYMGAECGVMLIWTAAR